MVYKIIHFNIHLALWTFFFSMIFRQILAFCFVALFKKFSCASVALTSIFMPLCTVQCRLLLGGFGYKSE